MNAEDNDLNEPLLHVVCAAVRNLRTGVILPGVRHWSSDMKTLAGHLSAVNGFWKKEAEEGFLTNKGEFLTREQAWIIAEKAGQIRPHPSVKPGTLHSEDLY